MSDGLQIIYLPVADLVGYEHNTRTHSEAQVAQIARSITEFGFTNPVLVDAGTGIIAGHGRVLAARTLGLQLVPCLRLGHLTPTQKRAYIIADNKLALNAGWDMDLLSAELSALQADDFNLSFTGFSDDELNALLIDKTIGLTDPDDIPPAPAVPVTRLGDVWLLGRHRIVCGDSTDADTVSKCLNGVVPHLMVTDPPYGVEYEADWRNKSMRADGSPIAGRAVGKVLNDDRVDWSAAWALFPGEVAYVWHAMVNSSEVARNLEATGFGIRAQIIWAKSQFAISRGHYHPQHESCWYAVKNKTGATGHWSGSRKESTLWQISKPQKSETGHSTQKPVECMRRPIENNSSVGQAIYEPFSGSGTTIIAAEETGRSCHAIELNPAYVDVAVLRWQNFTGGGGSTRVGWQDLRRGCRA
jgi:DNA modification methylase